MPFFIVLFFVSCSETSGDAKLPDDPFLNSDCRDSELKKIGLYILDQFPGYSFADTSFIYPTQISTLYRDSLYHSTACESPLFYSEDLNVDGYPEYLSYIYKIEPNLHTPVENDSIKTIFAVLVFQNSIEIRHTTEKIYYKTGVYQNKSSLVIEQNVAFLKPGTYERRYLYQDSIYIEQPGLLTYSVYGAAVMQWYNADSSIIFGLYSD